MIDLLEIASAGFVVGLFFGGAVLALGAAFRLMRFPDITVEGSFLIGASVWVTCIEGGWAAGFATLGAIVAGAACGVMTAAFHDILGVDRFLAGILTTACCFSLALLVMGTSNVGLYDAPSPMGESLAAATPGPVLAMLFAAVVSIAVAGFFSTAVGLRCRAASSNAGTFRRNIGGTFPYVAGGLAVTNGVAALAGVVFARYQGFVDVGMGQGVLITSLAALAVGEAITRWWRIPTLPSLLLSVWVGSVLYQWALSAALGAGFPAATTKLVTAVIVVVFLALQHRLGRLRFMEVTQ